MVRSASAEENHKPLIAIFGAGMMGSGIAQVCIQAGYSVNLYGRSEKKLLEARETIKKNLIRIAGKKKADVPMEPETLEQIAQLQLQLLQIHTDIASAAENASMAIEAVAENLELKLDIFQTIQKDCPENCILITNTSSLKLSQMLPVIKNPALFAGLHFFSPVPVMKLVEVVSTEQTSEDTTQYLFEFCNEIKKLPVAAKDTPGFIVNRLLIPYLMDSIRMLERGDAAKEDIDTAMRFGTSYPMGPIELCDYVGLDVLQSTLKIFRETIPGDARFAAIPLLDKLVSEGKLGRKTKQGFYSY
uniref:3-hydroxyacyl-CoA dehydrogenase n=2 Tax=Caenorhabditis japonica TaxID=281687 RepID=A0A8R1E7H0_CAEJA